MSLIERLRADAADDLLAAESETFETARFAGPDEIAAAVESLVEEPGAEAVLLALALRREAPKAYASIPAEVRADVLVSALRERSALNDFGYIDEDGGFDREAGHALLELGEAAIGPLASELDDLGDGQLEGSEEATLAEVYRLRRADFAYRYLSLILGREPEFDPDPAVRDEHIAELREALRGS